MTHFPSPCRVRDHPGRALLVLPPEIDLSNAPALRAGVLAFAAARAGRLDVLVLDLTRGTAEVLDAPDSVEPLVEYYRNIAGEHPDWDEYREAMVRQGKSIIRITPRRWGPVATGGFPARLAARDE
ncbi:hypothetical protein ACFCYB_36765 [Streptomyces sp. NPDC056309]|uniref:hypothetical protein n=1 Tax=unclassified Streptomyces TaxID=2593676 RepID=UPI0035E259FB